MIKLRADHPDVYERVLCSLFGVFMLKSLNDKTPQIDGLRGFLERTRLQPVRHPFYQLRIFSQRIFSQSQRENILARSSV